MDSLASWDKYLDPQVFSEAIDLFTEKRPGTLNRTEIITQSGLYRLSRRECALYSILILSCGGWGAVATYNAKGEMKFYQPSVFTGSFFHRIWHEGGMFLKAKCIRGADTILTISWEELESE